MKKVLLFDYDGVVVDSLPIICSTYNGLFKKYGINLNYSEEEFSEFYISNFHESLAKAVPADILPTILDEKGETFVKRNKDFKIFPGMIKILNKLTENNVVIIITSNTTKFVQENMKLNNLPELEVIGGDIELSKVKKIKVKKEKYPDAEIYYIGDTQGDVKEAKEAKVKSVAVTWGFHHRELLEKENPDYLLDRPEELSKLY